MQTGNWAPPPYPVSEDESHMGQTKNRPSEKLNKETSKIKIFAKNCLREHLTKISEKIPFNSCIIKTSPL